MPLTFPLFRAAERTTRRTLYHWLRDLRQTTDVAEVESALIRWSAMRERTHPLDSLALRLVDGRIYAANHRLRMLRMKL